jgi:hypothetical protein
MTAMADGLGATPVGLSLPPTNDRGNWGEPRSVYVMLFVVGVGVVDDDACDFKAQFWHGLLVLAMNAFTIVRKSNHESYRNEPAGRNEAALLSRGSVRKRIVCCLRRC